MNPLVRIFVHQCSMFISIILHFSLSLYCFSILFSFIAFCYSNPTTPFLLFSNNLLPYQLIDILPYSTSYHFSCFDILSPTISLIFSQSLSVPPSPSVSVTFSLSHYLPLLLLFGQSLSSSTFHLGTSQENLWHIPKG